MTETYAVILAGGTAEQLRPLSTAEKPAQFLPLLEDRSMLQQVADLIAPIIPPERTLVATLREHVRFVRDQMPPLPADHIVAEPSDRGTAASLALTTWILHDRAPRAVVLAVPTDRQIADREAFRSLLRAASAIAAAGPHLVTFGVPADRAAPNRDCTRAVVPCDGPSKPDGVNVLHAEGFFRTPDRAAPRRGEQRGRFGDSGMLVGSVDTIQEEVREHLPDLHRSLSKLPPVGTSGFETSLAEAYAGIDRRSIGRLLANSDRILLIPARDIGWNDVGGWEALRDVLSYREKPWGHEHLWALNEHYAGKFLHIKGGESLSLQYHEVKDETIHVVKGKLLLRIGETEDSLEERILSPGDSCDIPPGTVHQMEALENCVIAEVSTPHLDDVVRLRDRYGREDTPSDRG